MTMPDKTTETSEHAEQPSAWSRLPDTGETEHPGRSEGRNQSSVLAVGIREGLAKASRLVEAGQQEFERLVGRSDLPELGDADPMRTLAVRLDREADLWRALALAEIARATWIDRVVQATSIFAFLGTLALAFVGWAGALLGPAEASSRALLVTAGVIALGVGAGIVAWVGSTVRTARNKIAREALARADLTELRLHRLAVVLALREDDSGSFKEALLRLENETSAPPR